MRTTVSTSIIMQIKIVKNGARGAYWDIIRQNPYSLLDADNNQPYNASK